MGAEVINDEMENNLTFRHAYVNKYTTQMNQ